MTDEPSTAGDRIRRLLAGSLLLIPLAAVVVSWSLWKDGLPERVAFHWDVRGRVDGSMSAQPLALLSAAGAAVTFLVGAVMLVLPRVDPRSRRSSMYWLGAAGAFIAAMWLIPAGLTHAAGSVADATLEGWIAAFLLPFLFGVAPSLLTPKGSRSEPRSPRPIAMRPSEVGAWSQTVSTPLLYLVALVLAVIAALALLPALADPGLTGVLGLVVSALALLAVLSFASLRVTVDWRGLRVVSLLTRVPLKRIPLERIREVRVSDLRPGEWGGWGYRGMPGRSAIILGAGPGLVVATTDEQRFAMTLRDPEAAGALLLTLTNPADVGADLG